MAGTPVGDVSLFREALRVLSQPGIHGDILAIYLAFKFHQDSMPTLGDSRERISSSGMENLLDRFYTKPRVAPSSAAPVCMIFNDKFKPYSSYDTNSWRDFFRYGNGVGCLASEAELLGDFVGQPRSVCPHRVDRPKGKTGCGLHRQQTPYIRGLGKPKLLHWDQYGHSYKTVDLNHPDVIESLRPLTADLPLESLIIALYHDAYWHSTTEVSVEQFAQDFHFANVSTVEYLFSIPSVDPVLQAQVDERARVIRTMVRRPFRLSDPQPVSLSLVERRVRDLAFRRSVRDAYDNACAVCSLRVKSNVGHWEVHAAHIYPHRLGGTDDVRNGIALCRSHHWAFDEHLFTIDRNYDLVWGRNADREWRRIYTHLCLPDDRASRPDQDQALEWHRAGFRP